MKTTKQAMTEVRVFLHGVSESLLPILEDMRKIGGGGYLNLAIFNDEKGVHISINNSEQSRLYFSDYYDGKKWLVGSERGF